MTDRFIHRGLTLVETLLALTLLASVLAAGNAWVHATSRASKELSRRTQWRASAEAFLQLIHDQLAEFESWPTDDDDKLPALWRDSRLSIATRDIDLALALHQYRLDAQRGLIVAQVCDVEGDPIGNVAPESVMLASVYEFDCVIDEDARSLTVSIRSVDAHLAQRLYRLP